MTHSHHLWSNHSPHFSPFFCSVEPWAAVLLRAPDSTWFWGAVWARRLGAVWRVWRLLMQVVVTLLELLQGLCEALHLFALPKARGEHRVPTELAFGFNERPQKNTQQIRNKTAVAEVGRCPFDGDSVHFGPFFHTMWP